MVGMMSTDPPHDNSCGKCSDSQWTSLTLCEGDGTCSMGNYTNEEACVSQDNIACDDGCPEPTWTQFNTWTALTPDDAGWEQCKTQVGTYTSLGCCINSILPVIPASEAAVLQKLFADAEITLPRACSLDAVTLSATITVSGMSIAQCNAFILAIIDDVSLDAGVGKWHVKDTTCTAAAAAGRFRALSGSDGDAVDITCNLLLSDDTNADTVSLALTNNLAFATTQQMAGKNGVKLNVSATVQTLTPIPNPDCTGTVVNSNATCPNSVDSDSSDLLTSLSNPEVYLTLGTLAGMAVVGLLFLGCAAMRKPDSSRGKHENDARYGTQEERMDLKFST